MTDKQIIFDNVDISECKELCSLKICEGVQCAKFNILKAKRDSDFLEALKTELEAYKMESDEGKEINAELKADNKHLNDLLNQALKELEEHREAIEKVREIAKELTQTKIPFWAIYEQITEICDEVNKCENQ